MALDERFIDEIHALVKEKIDTLINLIKSKDDVKKIIERIYSHALNPSETFKYPYPSNPKANEMSDQLMLLINNPCFYFRQYPSPRLASFNIIVMPNDANDIKNEAISALKKYLDDSEKLREEQRTVAHVTSMQTESAAMLLLRDKCQVELKKSESTKTNQLGTIEIKKDSAPPTKRLKVESLKFQTFFSAYHFSSHFTLKMGGQTIFPPSSDTSILSCIHKFTLALKNAMDLIAKQQSNNLDVQTGKIFNHGYHAFLKECKQIREYSRLISSEDESFQINKLDELKTRLKEIVKRFHEKSLESFPVTLSFTEKFYALDQKSTFSCGKK